MKFYISAKGIKKVTISNGAGTGKEPAKTTTAGAVAAARRIPVRSLLPVLLVLGIVLPFLFVRVAILMLESATVCSSVGNFHYNFLISLFSHFHVLFLLSPVTYFASSVKCFVWAREAVKKEVIAEYNNFLLLQ